MVMPDDITDFLDKRLFGSQFNQDRGSNGRSLQFLIFCGRRIIFSFTFWYSDIMKNGSHVIGLFQGMFEQNIMTFNPGWNSDGETLDEFTDVRELQRQLKKQGVVLINEADESTTGPANFIVLDPDGNPILIDQHV